MQTLKLILLIALAGLGGGLAAAAFPARPAARRYSSAETPPALRNSRPDRPLYTGAGPNGPYLDLMKLVLTDLIYENDPKVRAAVIEGRRRPSRAHTMIGLKRLDNLQRLAEDVIARGVPGDFIEAGAWRGGATIFMRAVLKAHGVTDRQVWVADSFEGVPPPDPDKYPADRGIVLHTYDELAVSLEEVQANFERYGLLDNRVRFLKGWFKDTLPGAPIKQLAILRVDADLYESTMEALDALYPKLSPGGYVIIDDSAIKACAQAVRDYRAAHNIKAPVEQIDYTGVFWKKPPIEGVSDAPAPAVSAP